MAIEIIFSLYIGIMITAFYVMNTPALIPVFVALIFALPFVCFFGGLIIEFIDSVNYFSAEADYAAQRKAGEKHFANDKSLPEKDHISKIQKNIDFTARFLESASSCVTDQAMAKSISSVREVIEKLGAEIEKDKVPFTKAHAEEIDICMTCLIDILQKYIDIELSEEDRAIMIQSGMATIVPVFMTILEDIKESHKQGEYISHMQPSPAEIMTNCRDMFVFQQDPEDALEINGQNEAEGTMPIKPVSSKEATALFQYLSEDMSVFAGKIKNKQMQEYLTTLSRILEKIINKQKAGIKNSASSIYYDETKKLIDAYIELESIPTKTAQESARKILDIMPDIIQLYRGILDSMWENDAMDAEITAHVLIEKGQMDGYLPGQMVQTKKG